MLRLSAVNTFPLFMPPVPGRPASALRAGRTRAKAGGIASRLPVQLRAVRRLMPQEPSPVAHRDHDVLWPARQARIAARREPLAAGARVPSSAVGTETRGGGAAARNVSRKPEAPRDKASASVVVDIDEAVHGLYAAIKFGLDAGSGEAAHVAEQLCEEASGLAQTPLYWMRSEALPNSGTEMALVLGSGALMLPLAGMAIKAGREEIREARDTLAQLKGAMSDVRSQAETQRQALAECEQQCDGKAPPLLLADHARLRQRFVDLRFERQSARMDAGVGISSVASGVAILAKVGEEMALQGGLALAAKGSSLPALVANNSTAAGVATVSGAAGTLVLGPLASVFAVTLGGFFTHQSRIEKQRLLDDKKQVLAFLAALPPMSAGSPDSSYRAFLEGKLAQRERFFSRFAKWNIGFLSGSSLYAASTLSKMGLGIAALAGVSALGGPIALGGLLVGGIVGAGVMGISSHQYLFAHGRYKRYLGYRREACAEVDRAGLVLPDALARCVEPRSLGASHPAHGLGFSLRGALFDQVDRREKALQALLVRAATDQSKFYRPLARSTDAVGGGKTSRRRWLPQEAKARSRAVGTFVRTLFGARSLQAARQRSRQTYQRETPLMNSMVLEQWLDRPETLRPQLETLRYCLEAHIDYLASKQEAGRVLLSGETASPGGEGVAAEQAVSDLVASLRQSADEDSAKLAQCVQTLRLLDRLQAQVGMPAEPDQADQLATLRHRFVCLQAGRDGDALPVPVPSPAEARRAFARFVMRESPSYFAAVRGTLLDTEMLAARVRERAGVRFF